MYQYMWMTMIRPWIKVGGAKPLELDEVVWGREDMWCSYRWAGQEGLGVAWLMDSIRVYVWSQWVSIAIYSDNSSGCQMSGWQLIGVCPLYSYSPAVTVGTSTGVGMATSALVLMPSLDPSPHCTKEANLWGGATLAVSQYVQEAIIITRGQHFTVDSSNRRLDTMVTWE